MAELRSPVIIIKIPPEPLATSSHQATAGGDPRRTRSAPQPLLDRDSRSAWGDLRWPRPCDTGSRQKPPTANRCQLVEVATNNNTTAYPDDTLRGEPNRLGVIKAVYRGTTRQFNSAFSLAHGQRFDKSKTRGRAFAFGHTGRGKRPWPLHPPVRQGSQRPRAGWPINGASAGDEASICGDGGPRLPANPPAGSVGLAFQVHLSTTVSSRGRAVTAGSKSPINLPAQNLSEWPLGVGRPAVASAMRHRQPPKTANRQPVQLVEVATNNNTTAYPDDTLRGNPTGWESLRRFTEAHGCCLRSASCGLLPTDVWSNHRTFRAFHHQPFVPRRPPRSRRTCRIESEENLRVFLCPAPAESRK
ncbi:hypothetical protein SKAU_G00214680 [Synaphobranchus kaupii]|uniref:Uncharacterized protein n=1 Tax=Synaphobranchus kaupii TaxID=118154 RepID=A0A9Q1FA57_SYNKA|nr:hypothetical protein SKAU_G00214680 [Synaphobranchus kaupii]